ncbi:MAG: arginine--tRNA ligase [bacterium]
MNQKEYILKKIKDLFPDLDVKSLEDLFEIPREIKMGDLAFPCFVLAKNLKKNPLEIAKEVASNISKDDVILKVEAIGPYVNFFFQPKYIFQTVCKEILKQKNKYGCSNFGKDQKILVEYSGPNTNKPLHLGHARNNILGMAVSNVLETAGYKVVKANLINDRGVHINKSMLAYQKWGFGKTYQSENKKSDYFVGEYYVLYDQMKKECPEIEDEIKVMLKKWEDGDKNILSLWKKMRKWAIDGMNETYKRMGTKFDVVYYESDTYLEGKEIVKQGLKDKIFKKEKTGEITIDLTEQGLDKKILLRSDGTALYITQDIATSKRKFDEHHPDKAIWVVCNEQDYHFNVLFEVLEKLKIVEKKNLFHLSYGEVKLTTGRMKSREGIVVDVDNLMDELHEMAKAEIKKRDDKIEDGELERRAEIISQSALKYYLIKSNPKKDITFNPQESISFDGNTGPYIQYAYARIQSIINKKKITAKDGVFGLLGNLEERVLVNLLAEFPQVVRASALEYNPADIANFVYELAQGFNRFYHGHSVLSADSEDLIQARLKLILAVGIVLKNGLGLLGIDVVEKM